MLLRSHLQLPALGASTATAVATCLLPRAASPSLSAAMRTPRRGALTIPAATIPLLGAGVPRPSTRVHRSIGNVLFMLTAHYFHTPLADEVDHVWSLSPLERNRLQHAFNGKISAEDDVYPDGAGNTVQQVVAVSSADASNTDHNCYDFDSGCQASRSNTPLVAITNRRVALRSNCRHTRIQTIPTEGLRCYVRGCSSVAFGWKSMMKHLLHCHPISQAQVKGDVFAPKQP